jgi:hypothetical protein
MHLKNSDNIRQHPKKCLQPDGKTSDKVFDMPYHMNIQVPALGDPHSALLDMIELESCNYESESTIAD